jgi:thiamine-monophosphate kinase
VDCRLEVSDGLHADLRHICEVSELAALIEGWRVPLSTTARAARAALAVSPGRIATALTGGDDYEILFTAPPTAMGKLTEWPRTLDVPITAIGRMESPAIG